MTDERFVIPEQAVTHFHLRPGDVVADFGAGTGYFTTVLARSVAPDGRVFALEIQKNLIEKLVDKVRQDRLSNVEVKWVDLEAIGGSKLEDGSLDAALVANTLFQMEARAAALQEIARTLRGGGKLFIIDWSESWGGMGPQPGQVLSQSEARALAEAAGLTFERTFDVGRHHYGLAFRK